MDDAACVRFLCWALPRLGMRWSGFRKVRRQVCKRIHRRLLELDLRDVRAYQSYLESNPDEWTLLDSLCRITISRFYRDRKFYEFMERAVIPKLTRLARDRGDTEIRCWSAGSASGEEPYTVNILWKLGSRGTLPLRILATDIDAHVIGRARSGCYSWSSIKEVPEEWRGEVFERRPDGYAVRACFRQGIEFLVQDVRDEQPRGPFHMILCRNFVFTYFDQALQRKVLSKMLGALVPRGVLAVGGRESLPECTATRQLDVWEDKLRIFQKRP
jgi:chemotaxis protein methyltransferase CheR